MDIKDEISYNFLTIAS